MAGNDVPMAPEILKGIFGGLGLIIVAVTIGSLIGSALSGGHHGDDHGGEAKQEAPAGEAP